MDQLPRWLSPVSPPVNSTKHIVRARLGDGSARIFNLNDSQPMLTLQRGAMIHKTEQRNREIFAAYYLGADLRELASRYALSPITVQQILLSERHKLQVSDDPFYRAARLGMSSDHGLEKMRW